MIPQPGLTGIREIRLRNRLERRRRDAYALKSAVDCVVDHISYLECLMDLHHLTEETKQRQAAIIVQAVLKLAGKA